MVPILTSAYVIGPALSVGAVAFLAASLRWIFTDSVLPAAPAGGRHVPRPAAPVAAHRADHPPGLWREVGAGGRRSGEKNPAADPVGMTGGTEGGAAACRLVAQHEPAVEDVPGHQRGAAADGGQPGRHRPQGGV